MTPAELAIVVMGEMETEMERDTRLPDKPEYRAAWSLGYAAAMRVMRWEALKAQMGAAQRLQDGS